MLEKHLCKQSPLVCVVLKGGDHHTQIGLQTAGPGQPEGGHGLGCYHYVSIALLFCLCLMMSSQILARDLVRTTNHVMYYDIIVCCTEYIILKQNFYACGVYVMA